MKATITGLVLSLVLLFAVAVFAQGNPKTKNIYKTFHISPSDIGITCQNGVDPTGRKVGDILIISCK